jgi:hypothetical protein
MPHSYGSDFAGLNELGAMSIENAMAPPTNTSAITKKRISD